MTENELYWIWLSALPGLGSIGIGRLLERFGSAQALYEASEQTLTREGVRPRLRQLLLQRDLSAARALAEDCEGRGFSLLCPDNPGYPAALRQIPDPPPVLYLRGRLPPVDILPVIALVGSRGSDLRGDETARRLGFQIAGCGGVVCTGLARGIDSESARGALEYGGRVIGVLGCGLDVVYPRENGPLYDAVCGEGCLISEYPPGTAPLAGHFPARNRIISALSDGIVVVQAGQKSGALITAEHAAEQGRDIFAVPGRVDDPLSAGSNALIRQGAALVGSGWDVMSEYEFRYPTAVREFHGRPLSREEREAEALPAALRQAAKSAEKPRATAPVRVPRPDAAELAGLNETQRAIVLALQDGPLQLDELISRVGLSTASVLAELTLLQIRGRVAVSPGRICALK